MKKVVWKLAKMVMPEEKLHSAGRKAVLAVIVSSIALNPLYSVVSAYVWSKARIRWGRQRISMACIGIAVLLALVACRDMTSLQEGISGIIIGEFALLRWLIFPQTWRMLACPAIVAALNGASGTVLEMDADEFLVYKMERREKEKREIRKGTYDHPRCNILCVGTTGSGKTTIMKHLIDREIRKGEPVVILSAKRGTDDPQEYYHAIGAACERYGRRFVVFSTDPESKRVPYSPLKRLDVMEVADKLTEIAGFSESYYSQAYRDWIQGICQIIIESGKEISIQNILKLYDIDKFKKQVALMRKQGMYSNEMFENIMGDMRSAEISQTSKAALKTMVSGELGEMFGTGEESVSICDAVEAKDVVLVNLDSFKYEEMTRKIGQLAIMDLHHAIGGMSQETGSLSVFMDEVSSYFDKMILQICKQGRSNGVSIVLGSQSFADLSLPGMVKERVVENMNAFLLMRQNEPGDAEYASSIVGTEYAVQTTSRVDGEEFPGMGSSRAVKEYKCHPDIFKELGSLEAVYCRKEKDGKGRMDPVLVKWDYYDPWKGVKSNKKKKAKEEYVSKTVLTLFD